MTWWSTSSKPQSKRSRWYKCRATIMFVGTSDCPLPTHDSMGLSAAFMTSKIVVATTTMLAIVCSAIHLARKRRQKRMSSTPNCNRAAWSVRAAWFGACPALVGALPAK
eukprot:7053036-Prymnesium_polylepis.1